MLLKTRTQYILISVLFTLFLGVLFFEVPFLHAQSLFNIPQTATLKANPSYPGPNTSVTISLDDYSIDTVGARITWLVDGTELKDETNARSIKIQTGKLGQKKVIKTILSRPSAPSITSSLVLIPVAVDIILEAKTYTPLFYTGRPLPSMESPMRAIALVQTGGAQGPESFTYIWSLGATVLNGGPIKGKYMLDFVMPRYDQKTLSVQVLDQNGTPIGRSAATLEAEEPEILFYEHSALRGLGQKTIASPYPLLGEEATIYGEPYFTHSAVGADTTSFDWKIDGEDATSEPGIPNAISLRRTGDAGSARISLSVTTKDRIPQFVSNTFNLFFK